MRQQSERFNRTSFVFRDVGTSNPAETLLAPSIRHGFETSRGPVHSSRKGGSRGDAPLLLGFQHACVAASTLEILALYAENAPLDSLRRHATSSRKFVTGQCPGAPRNDSSRGERAQGRGTEDFPGGVHARSAREFVIVDRNCPFRMKFTLPQAKVDGPRVFQRDGEGGVDELLQ